MKSYFFLIPALLLILQFTSCTKKDDCNQQFFYGKENPIPERALRNYYRFPTTDSFMVYGIKNSSFRFLYVEKDPAVIKHKLYLKENYQHKMAALAQNACQRILDEVVVTTDFLVSFQMTIALYNSQNAEIPDLSWPLYQIRP